MADGFNQDLDLARLMLDQLDKRVVAVLPEAAQEAALILKQAAVDLAPKDTVELANSASDSPIEADDIHASHRVSFDAPHAIVQEYGIKVARIVPKSKKSLRFGGSGGDHAKGVPPGRTQSFLRPAAIQKRREMFLAIQDVVDRVAGEAILTFKSRKRSGS